MAPPMPIIWMWRFFRCLAYPVSPESRESDAAEFFSASGVEDIRCLS